MTIPLAARAPAAPITSGARLPAIPPALAITLLAWILRIYALAAKGFWGDEIWMAQAATQPLRQLLPQVPNLMDAGRMPGPFYFVLAHFSNHVFGTASPEFALRAPSVLAAILVVPVTFALFRTWFRPPEALLAALLVAVSPFQVWYAQEARYYAWTTLLAGLATLGLVRALARPTRLLPWLIFVAAGIAGLYNQPVCAAIVLAAQGSFFVIHLATTRDRRSAILGGVAAFGLVVLGYAPIIADAIRSSYLTESQPALAQAQAGFFAPSLVQAGRRIAWIANDLLLRLSGGTSTVVPLGVLFAAGLLAAALRRQGRFLLLALAYVFWSLVVFGVLRPATGYIARYVLFLQPWYLGCAAVGVVGLVRACTPGIFRSGEPPVGHSEQVGPGTPATARLRRGISRLGAAAGAGAGAALVVLSTITTVQGYSQAKVNDWRSISAYLERELAPGDVVTGSRWYRAALDWYFDRDEDVTFSPDDNPALSEDVELGRRVWYVEIGEPESPAARKLAALLEPVPHAAWQQPGMDYAPEFYPLSEYPARLLVSQTEGASGIRFYDILNPAWTDRDYRELKPGESTRFRLASTEERDSVLEVVYFDHPRKELAVTVDGHQVVIGGKGGDWQTARIPVGRVTSVLVTVTAAGTEPAAVASAELAVR